MLSKNFEFEMFDVKGNKCLKLYQKNQCEISHTHHLKNCNRIALLCYDTIVGESLGGWNGLT